MASPRLCTGVCLPTSLGPGSLDVIMRCWMPPPQPVPTVHLASRGTVVRFQSNKDGAFDHLSNTCIVAGQSSFIHWHLSLICLLPVFVSCGGMLCEIWPFVHPIWNWMLHLFKERFHFLREDMDTKEVNFIV